MYRDAFLAHARLTRSFRLWHGCNAATNLTGFASWVPDWSASLGADTYFIGNDARASHSTVVHFTYEAPNRLTVAAIRVGTFVEGSAEEVRDEPALRRITEKTLPFKDRMLALPEVLCLGNPRADAGAYVDTMRRFLQNPDRGKLDHDQTAMILGIPRSQQGRVLVTLSTSSGNLFASVRGDKGGIQAGK